MLSLYTSLTKYSAPLLKYMLHRRQKKGKEDAARLHERMGAPQRPRPDGKLIWFHAASVGEAQSTLILIDALKEAYPEAHFLVTTGTVTSAELMQKRLGSRCFHQYYPVDHPKWVAGFLDHWQPDFALWMESELWPNMLMAIKERHIPAALVNARLSPKSLERWQKSKKAARKLIDALSIILTQTEKDAEAFKSLGAENVQITDNLKYSAAPLPYDENDLKKLQDAIGSRPLWLYASTHDGEEDLACRLHTQLRKGLPNVLTIIVPRHPERRESVVNSCKRYDLPYCLRTEKHNLPQETDTIYIADTMGELGLFYALSPLACIGRSFSRDGGGGHNPIEAAQHSCAVLHGPNVQNLQQIFDDMDKEGAALRLKDEKDFETRLQRLLNDEEGLAALQNKGHRFVSEKSVVLKKIMAALSPIADHAFHKDTGGTKCA